jgi:hypothetical protein
MVTSKHTIRALSCLLSPLVIAGCGSSGADGARHGSGAGTTVSARGSAGSGNPGPGLIAQADSICQRVNAAFAANVPNSHSPEVIARLAPERAALEQKAVTQLSRLVAPAPLQRDWQQIITYRRTLARELRMLGQKAKENDMPALDALIKSKQSVHEKLSALADRNGFKQCGKVG